MLSSVFIYISTQSFNFAITVGLLYLFVTIVRHSKQRDGLYIVDVETGTDPTIDSDNGHNGYDIPPRDTSAETESETQTEKSQTSCEGESVSTPSTDPDIHEETPPETDESGNETPLKEE